jgi:hypothetical protein
MINSVEVSAVVATRARIVVWCDEKRLKQDVARLAGLSRPTVDAWLARYESEVPPAFWGTSAARVQVPARTWARALALSRAKPPHETGLSHWRTSAASSGSQVESAKVTSSAASTCQGTSSDRLSYGDRMPPELTRLLRALPD